MAAVSTISGSIKWTGLASGTDFGKVVEELVAIEQRAVTKQQNWQTDWKNKLTAITGLDTQLGALKMDSQGYDSRDELLARAAVSSDEKVATLTNLSTAATGIYEVEVGENIREKIGSGTYQNSQAIGLAASALGRDDEGVLLDANGQPVLLPGIDETYLTGLGLTLGSDGYVLAADGTRNDEYFYHVNDNGHLTDHTGALMIDSAYTGAISAHDGEYGGLSGYPVNAAGDILYEALAAFPAGTGPQPLTISMGGQTLTLNYDPAADPAAAAPGVYNGRFTMEQLADAINSTVAAAGGAGPDLSAEVVFDKNRGGQDYSRLVITGGQGGSANHITVSDPTNLKLNRNNFDQPMLTNLVGSTARPVITADSLYTGSSNKTITFVPSVTGVLGENDISISWADTEGHKGTFVLKASDWDAANNRMDFRDADGNPVEGIEILQGLKLNFNFGTQGNFIEKEAFTIDCQTPIMQQAADNGLASADKWIHRGFPDQTSPVTKGAAGNFDFSYAGVNYSVPVSDLVGLSGLAEAINNYSKNPGVIASVINDGMGTATSYKLVLTGVDTGIEHRLEILDTTKLNQMDCSAGTFEHARRAANSMSRVDGYPNDGVTWLQRPSNEVGDVLDGTVITLVGPGKASVTVKNDVTEMATRIKALIETVNSTKSYIKQYTAWGGGKLVSKVLKDGTFQRTTEGGEASGIMIGNYGFQIALSEIDRLMTKEIFTQNEYILALDPKKEKEFLLPKDEQKELFDKYKEENGLVYTRLVDIGIVSKAGTGDPGTGTALDGGYTIEESTLRECLTKNPEAVIKLFTFQPKEADIAKHTPLEDEQPRPQIGGFSVMMGYRMSDLTRSNDVIDPKTGDVIRPAKGITKVLAENYNNIISGIDDKIAREEKRISLYQERLELKFSRLETLLDQLNKKQESISSQLEKLAG